jgi:hypothetical protein
MPTRQQLDRLAALESGYGRGHTSSATYDPETEDPAEVFARLVAEGKVAESRGTMMVPKAVTVDEWQQIADRCQEKFR